MYPSWGRKHRASDLSGLLRPLARVSGSMSTKLVRLAAVLGCILVAAAPGAWAGPSLILGGTGTVLTLNGLTLTVTGCTVNGVNCTTSNNIELLGVSTGRGTVTVDVIGTGGGPVFSISSGSATDTLVLSLSAATNEPATAKVSSATLTLNGSGPAGWSSSDHANWSQTDSRSPNPAVLALATGSGSAANTANTTWTPTTPGSTFTITDTIALTRTSGYGNTLQLTSAVEKFFTTPEPASIGVLLLGLGGLAMARRRRASRADAA
jgi:hypothetical protein